MRFRESCAAVLVLLAITLPCAAQAPSKKDQKHAREAYKQALKLIEKEKNAEASDLLDQAADLDPTRAEYAIARETLRQLDARDHLKRGTLLMSAGDNENAAREFRAALGLDPQNPVAEERLRSMAAQVLNDRAAHLKIQYRDEDSVVLAPGDAKREIHFRGSTRQLIELVWKNYGITALVDSGVQERQQRIDVEALDFAQAITLLTRLTRTFYVALSPKQVVVFNDTADQRRQFERLALRTFFVSSGGTPQDLTDLQNLLRTIFEFRFLASAPAQGEIIARAPRELLETATRIIQDLDQGKPQVMLDVKIYEIDSSLARDLGITIPTQFRIFNVNTEAANLLNNPSTQQLIQQLIASGGINQANTTAIAALLAGLASQGNSLLTQPIATFGGGLTRNGIVLPGTTARFSINDSTIKTLEHVTLRALQGDAATFRVGTRVPILNAIFSPISSSAALNQVLGNQTFTAPFPSFNYEDLGVTVKATPFVQRSSDVRLKLELQIRGLGTQSFNGVPVITNREYNGTINLLDGETAVVAGSLSHSDQKTLTGIPGFALIPGLKQLTSVTSKQVDTAEILVTVTPHIISAEDHRPGGGQAFLPPAP